MEDLKHWCRETSEMQTWQWNYGTLTLHKVQRNDGTVTMEDLKQWPREASEMQTCQWNYGTLTLQGAVEKWDRHNGRFEAVAPGDL